jgi:hypothetical protein
LPPVNVGEVEIRSETIVSSAVANGARNRAASDGAIDASGLPPPGLADLMAL